VGFAHETNAVTILGRDGQKSEVALADKSTIAAAILDVVAGELAPPAGRAED
jgi:hypothetical protein